MDKGKMMCVVYCFENKINGKKYIGSTIDFRQRFYSHIRNSTNKELKLDIDTYGLSIFSFTILEFLEFCFNEDKIYIKKKLLDIEQKYIDLFLKNKNGKINKEISYNISELSNCSKYEFSEEVRSKMSFSAKNKVFTDSHKKNISKNHFSKKEGFVSWCKGKEMSSTSKEKLLKHSIESKIPICQYDKNGIFLKKYESIREAAYLNNFDSGNISKAVSSNIKTYKNCYWKKFEGSIENLTSKKFILMLDVDLLEVGRFNNMFEIEKKTGIHHTNVSRAIKNGKSTMGFYFKKVIIDE